MKMAALQDGDKCVPEGAGAGAEKEPYFPAIPALGKNSRLEAAGSQKYELQNFILYQADAGGEAKASEETMPRNMLGLIGINRGTIQGLTFTGVKARGVKNVGAVCGINADNGKVRDTAVAGKVRGKENIGGIVGLDMAASGSGDDPGVMPEEDELIKNSAYTNLVNYAEVTGSEGKIGGIAGSLGEKGQAYRCENYGAVKGTETETVYIGGITGYNKGLVQNCTSAPDDKPPRRQADGELEETALKGIFVGGIVGCNNGGTIRDSSTEKETKTMSGTGGDAYVIGYRYVGGIVGYNNGAVGGGNEGTLVNTAGDRTNKAKVIGHNYVGGIVGANGFLKDNAISEEITPEHKAAFAACEIEDKYSPKMIVEDWVNEGIVEAAGSINTTGGSSGYHADGCYAGGIAGYNAGDLKNCTTKINTSSGGASDLIDQVRLYGKNASYVGGVAGYNVGHIYRDNGTVSVNSVVSGKKYVGGIVGYNGVAKEAADGSSLANSGKVENYALSGGYISAGSYAGGYVGLNTTEKLLLGADGKANMLKANPNEVTADYFAGGVMGALILVPENGGDITVNCATDNLFGNVNANDAFAGGYAGYTQVLAAGKDPEERAEELRGKIDEVIQKNQGQQRLQQLANTVLDERVQQTDHLSAGLQFKYEGTFGESRFASVEAPIFAGGVIGCNSWNTRLCLQNIYNKVRVAATGSVTYDFISTATNQKDGVEKQDTFSFAGGIIGLVTPKAQIISCGNSGTGDVQGMGTYAGGIAEVNLGMIRECEAAAVSNKDYYGGIVGLNTNDGRVENCRLKGQISGGSYLGGIAACNESTIIGCAVEAKAERESAVIGTGRYIGGIASINRIKEKPDGSSYANEIKDCAVSGNVGLLSMGETVGGLLGSYQGGSLTNVTIAENVTVYGRNLVGGIAGEIFADLSGTKENRIVNHANINAMYAAGGIGGRLADGIKITGVQNKGNVTSSGGMAGGIVPEILGKSVVKDCTHFGSVIATNDIAGGITAKNSGTVEYCTAESGSGGQTSKVTGERAVGGIAGENAGSIIYGGIAGDVAVSDVNAGGKNRAIGGIAGINAGEIKNVSITAGGGRRPQITTLSRESYLGGIAGTNIPDGVRKESGTIRTCVVNAEVILRTGQQGTVGGAVGGNAGTISNVSFLGKVEGTSGSRYGTGGIAGRNELAEAGKTGAVSACTLIGGSVSAASKDSGFGGYGDAVKGVYVGGICGFNPENGTISGCTLEGAVRVSGDYGYVGGITAYNLGLLSGNKPSNLESLKANWQNLGSKANEPKIEVSTGKCVMGGIAAYNGASGVLEDCAAGDWTVTNNISEEDQLYPTGGVIGCNKSIYDQTMLTNCAQVYGGWMTGGVIGLQITEKRSGFTIEQCENYGKVTAKYRSAGGIISDWRNQSGRVRECINHGEVAIEKGDTNKNNVGRERNAAGGIIGTGWWGTPVTIAIERCGNEGKISHQTNSGTKYGKAAGIFGAYNAQGTELTISFTDCYNAAEIQNDSSYMTSAGIFGGDEWGGTMKVAMTRCVNYGKGTDKNKRFGGIVSAKIGTYWVLTINDCLNVGECHTVGDQWPVAYNLSEKESNYYFKNPSTGGRESGPSSRKVAEHQENDTFKKVSNTSFDKSNNRLTLPAVSGDMSGRYLQFSNVGGKYDDSKTGVDKQSEILALKNAFSAYNYRKGKGTDDKYALLVYGITNGTFNPPANVALDEADGIYAVTFEPDADTLFCTAGYEVKITGKRRDNGAVETVKAERIDDPSRNSLNITETELFAGKQRTDYIELKASVRAEKVNSPDYSGITVKAENAENGRYYSDWEDSAWLSSKPRLPLPVFHFEMTTAADNNNAVLGGYWVLDNAEDYNTLCGGNWQVKLTDEGGTTVLDGTALRKEVANAANLTQSGKASRVVTAEAEPVGDSAETFQKSRPAEKMLNLYPRNCTQQAIAVEGSEEFIGTKANELRYRFSMKQPDANYQYLDITYMAEFWLGDEKLGEGTVALPNQRQEAYCTIDLSEKDPDETEEQHQEKIRRVMDGVSGTGNDIKVCFYPWEIEDVKYYVTNDATGEIESRTVPAAAGAKSGEATNKNAFNSSYTTRYLKNLKGYKMYPTPKPGEKVEPVTEDDGSITYTLYWDAALQDGTITEMTGEDYDGAEYAVTVTGKNDSTEVVLYQGAGDADADGKIRNKVTLKENNWKYRQLILTVERLGKEGDQAGSAHYIGASKTTEYTIPIRLSSIPRPTAKLRDRDSLVIDVEWIPSVEEGVGGYRIIMKGKDAVDKTVTVKTDVAGRDSKNIQIDLDEEAYADLRAAKEIEFFVVAVPRSEDAADYMDSRENEGYRVGIPERLDIPKEVPELMRGEEIVSADNALPPEAFTEFVLKLADDTASSEVAAYEVEYFIAGKDAADKGGLPENWDQTTGGRPATDPKKGIYSSTGPVRMTGNLQSAEYRLHQSDDFNAEQAGRMLWYRIRAVSDNKISSVWSSWEMRELPKALLKPAEIEKDRTVDREYSYTIEGAGATGDLHTVSMRQPKAGFVPVEFAKGYKIFIREATRKVWVYDPDTDTTEEKTVDPAERTYILQKAAPADDGTEPLRPFELLDGETGTPLDDAMGEAPDILQITTSGGETTYSYTLYTVTHSYNVMTSDGKYIYKIPAKARLCYRTKDNAVQEIWLELPEGAALAEDNTEISNRQFIATALVDITVTAPDSDRYVVEKLTRWQRVKDAQDNFVKIEITYETAETTDYNRMAVEGYYEDRLYLNEMSPRQLKLFGLKRVQEEILPEGQEEESGGKDVTGNNAGKEESGGKDATGNNAGKEESGGKDVTGNDVGKEESGGKDVTGNDVGKEESGGKDAAGNDAGKKESGGKDVSGNAV